MGSDSLGRVIVLHVDDDVDFVEMASEFIERYEERITVTTSTGASDGLEQLRTNDYDCVISDYDMPGRNGVEFLRAVRVENPDLPFILFTGKGSEEVASEAISAGVTDYLQKEGSTDQYAILANRVMNAVERTRTARELKKSRARYESLTEDVLDSSEVGTVILDSDFSVVWVNTAIAEFFGIENEAVVGADGRRLVESEIAPIFEHPEQFSERVIGTYDDNSNVEEFICHVLEDMGREERWLQHWSKPIETGLFAGGRIEHYTDITEQEHREQTLQETTSQLEAAISEKERQNNAFESFLDIVSDSTQSFEQRLDEMLDLGVEFLDLDIGIVAEIDPPDYTVRHVVTPDGSIEQGAQFDFSDTFCSLVYESDGPVAFHSPTAGDVEQHPAYRDLGLESYLGEPLFIDGERYGTVNFSSPNARPQSFTDGERAFIRTMAEWLSKELTRRERERELRESNERFRMMAENASDAIISIDTESTIQFANQAVQRIFGYDPFEVEGESLLMLIPSRYRDKHRAAIERYLDSGERGLDWVRIELHGLHKDGHEIPLEISFSELKRDDRYRFTGIIREVTD